jgi:hypothetical protein
VGDHLREYLDSWTLGDLATIAQGRAPWPGDGPN